MKRKEDWPELLNAVVHLRRDAPFEWGKNDCCLFACDVVLAMTGIDLAEEYRGRYSSALGAMRAVQPHGGVEGAFQLAAAKAEFPEIPVVVARRGDVLLLDTPHGPALGVCLGEVGAFTGQDGLRFIAVSECRKAWRTE